MSEQTKLNWLEVEATKLKEEAKQYGGQEYEELPPLKFIDKTITTFTVDASKEFKLYEDKVKGKFKRIIPVTHNGVKKILWLNIKNPLYSQLIERLSKGVTTFKVLQEGSQDKTKYHLVEEN